MVAENADLVIQERRGALNLRLLLSGSTASIMGSRTVAFAYPLLVLAVTGSSVMAGWVAFAAMVPSMIFYLPAGIFVDRWDPRRTMLICETGSGVVGLILVTALFLDRTGAIFLAACAFITGTLAVFYQLAEVKVVPLIVAQSDTPGALAKIEARNSLSSIVGRAAGGFLYAAAQFLPFLANALASLFSATLILLMRPARRAAPGNNRPGFRLTDFGPAMALFRRDRFFLASVLVGGVGNVIIHATFFVFLVGETLRGSSLTTLGLAFACTGAGGILGSLMANALFKRYGYRLYIYTLWTWAGAMAVLVVAVNQVGFAVAASLLTAAGTAGNVAVGTYVYRRVPEDILARVVSVDATFTFAGQAIGPVIGGVLLTFSGMRGAYSALFVSMALVAAGATAVPALRMADRSGSN